MSQLRLSGRYGPCLCGSPDCASCGPAQGYTRCELHGRMGCESCRECARCPAIFAARDDDQKLCPRCDSYRCAHGVLEDDYCAACEAPAMEAVS